MGFPVDGRPPGPYNPAMPILEALMTLAHISAVTSRVTLGTEILVLPQREPTLVAKQVSTLDTLSGGRVRLGIGVAGRNRSTRPWGADFHTRGARMDEAIALLRGYWVTRRSSTPASTTAPMPWPWSPPPQGARLPIWIGGYSEAASSRGPPGDGWLASRVTDAEDAKRAVESIRRHAAPPAAIPRASAQSMAASPPRDAESKRFYAEPDRWWRAAALQASGLSVGVAECHRDVPGRRALGGRHDRGTSGCFTAACAPRWAERHGQPRPRPAPRLRRDRARGPHASHLVAPRRHARGA